MAVGGKLWDALTTVIKMNDKIVTMSGQLQMVVVRIATALSAAARKARSNGGKDVPACFPAGRLRERLWATLFGRLSPSP